MIHRIRRELLSSPAFVLVAGRTVGFVLSFAIPVVLARIFDRPAFGTYKQLFLIYGTLYGLAQVGMAESLYFFVPSKPAHAGRHVANAIATLAAAGALCAVGLYFTRGAIADWLTNTHLGPYLPLIGLFLIFTLIAAVFEIVMVSRKQHLAAAAAYAGSDLVRTVFLVGPAVALWGLRGLLIGATAFAALRVAAMFVYVGREFGDGFRLDMGVWREQLAYALPFALAVGVEVVQANLHQYMVASRFDAATFAIYAVGCLQIPLVDLICTSTGNVMMVRMAEEAARGHRRDALALWHHTTIRLATLILPLAIFLVLAAHGIIVTLFTAAYAASVPIFMVWCLTIVPSVFQVDAVLRVYAQTRFLLAMNIIRLAMIGGCIGWFLTTFGLMGAVLITLAAMAVVRVAGIVKIARLMGVPALHVLPWKQLSGVALQSLVAAVPAFFVSRITSWPHPILLVMATGAVYAVTLAPFIAGAMVRLKPDTTESRATESSTTDSIKEIPPCVASQAS